MEKRIETVELDIRDLKDGLGNPRKISRKKKEELKRSLEMFGDFGIIVVDEHNNIISGHQRVSVMLAEGNFGEKVLCKRLVGYSKSELKAINIKANTHAGDWDVSKLAEWTADLHLDLGFELPVKDPDEDVKLKDMELIRYEKYNYVMIVCRNEYDFLKLLRDMDLEDKKVIVCPTKDGYRTINARAVWYDKYNVSITPKQ